ncbi:MAG: T9SS type A sorting domain-containing protein [Fidelibacterota bacterium]
MRRIVNGLLVLTLLFCWTTDLKAVKDVLKPNGYFTYKQKKESVMGSKLMQERRAAKSEAKERYEALKGQRIVGRSTSTNIERNSDLGDDAVPIKVDPAAVLGGGSRFPSEIQYGDGNTGIGGFIFEEDSAAVWFRPLTDAKVTGIGMYFNAETEMIGTDVTLYIRDIQDGPIEDPTGNGQTIDGNGDYDFTIYNEGIAPFMGDVLWSYTFPLTDSDVYPTWFEIDIPDSVDVGSRDFAITLFIPGADAADLMYYAGINGSGIPYNHGIKWYHTGGAYCAPNPCWVPRLNFVIHALVDYYGDPPPFVENVQDLDDVYESCDPGPYDVTADIYDIGTADFAGALTEVLFIYDDGSGPDTTDVTGQNDPTVGGTFTGTIPALGAGGAVSYWWSATDNGSEAVGGQDHITDGQFTPAAFAVHEASGANVLFITDTGSEDEYMAPMREFMDEVGYLSDSWVSFSMGTPGSCELGNYGTIIVGQGLNGYGSIGPDTDLEAALMAHMDAGGNFALISDDYIFGLGLGGSGDWETVDPSANPFLGNYLHVSDYWSDAQYPDPQDTAYAGIAGTFTENLTEFSAHPAWPDEVIETSDSDPLFDVYSYTEGDWVPFGGIQYEGSYKMAFVPWDMDLIDDDSVLVEFAASLMAWFGEETGPVLVAESRPTWGIPAGAHDLEFTYAIGDFDGSIASADLHLVLDGVYSVLPLTDNGDGTWSVTASVTLTDTSEAEYAVAGYDDSGNMGMSADEAFYGVDWAGTGAQILYMQDHYAPYDIYGPADADSVLIANLDAIGASYDKWDVWTNGLADNGTVLSSYEAILYTGVYDWDMWPEAAADHPLTAYVEGGGYLLYTSEEVLGTYGNWGDDYDVFWEGHFVHEVLGVEWVGNDYNYAAVAAYDDGEAGLLDGVAGTMDTAAIELDTLLDYFGSMADLCDPVGYGTPDMLPPIFLGLYAPPNGYYNGSLNGTSAFLAFNLSMMPDDQQQIFIGNWLGTVSIDNDVDGLPLEFTLHQNYPNPFNPTTTLSFAIPTDSKVDLVVYNLLGQEVTRIFDHKLMRAGVHKIVWDGKDKLGNPVSTGLYVYRLNAAGKSAAQKMLLLK